MDIIMLLTANSLFLVFILIILMLFMFLRNGKTIKGKVSEDIKKIKDQISKDE